MLYNGKLLNVREVTGLHISLHISKIFSILILSEFRKGCWDSAAAAAAVSTYTNGTNSGTATFTALGSVVGGSHSGGGSRGSGTISSDTASSSGVSHGTSTAVVSQLGTSSSPPQPQPLQQQNSSCARTATTTTDVSNSKKVSSDISTNSASTTSSIVTATTGNFTSVSYVHNKGGCANSLREISIVDIFATYMLQKEILPLLSIAKCLVSCSLSWHSSRGVRVR